MTTAQKIQRHFGTFLMISGVCLLGYIYFPIVRTYFFPTPSPVQAAIESDEYWLEIPKINAAAPVINNVNPWDEAQYKEALKDGIAHAKGSALPGKGKTYLFAHSSDYPWNITRYNTAFFKLHELQTGDEIVIKNGKKELVYIVSDKKEIWPTEVEYIKNQTADLILQTCTPIGTDLKRLLIFANLKK
jgi:LPXTG-site transpeptidase (sortase) family protein